MTEGERSIKDLSSGEIAAIGSAYPAWSKAKISRSFNVNLYAVNQIIKMKEAKEAKAEEQRSASILKKRIPTSPSGIYKRATEMIGAGMSPEFTARHLKVSYRDLMAILGRPVSGLGKSRHMRNQRSRFKAGYGKYT